jgi:glutamyl-tRNA synthetase
VTRLAPSPTGALHLGNARTFLINWALAKRRGWRIVLRVEDLDTPRTKAWASDQAIDVLTWLGMDWDAGPSYQRADLSRYEKALRQLASAGLIYPCICTRKDLVEAQSAPHKDSHDLIYPGTCRPAEPTATAYDPANESQAWRVRTDERVIAFDDGFAGAQAMSLALITGDFVVASKQGGPAYQLAVVVDDAAQGVTHIVRGDDLLTSTPRQLWLYDLLNLTPRPEYVHLPLVLGPDGRRLAKRHGDTRLISYREAGVAAERVVGLIAGWSGLDREPMSAETFAERFDLDRLPPEPAVFTQEDHRWLLDG